MKSEGLKRGLQSIDSSGYPVKENGTPLLTFDSHVRTQLYKWFSALIRTHWLTGDPGDMEEEAAKEREHTLLQDSLDKELNELNRRLEQKEVSWTLKLHLN